MAWGSGPSVVNREGRDYWRTWFIDECERSGMFGLTVGHLPLVRLKGVGVVPYHVGTLLYLRRCAILSGDAEEEAPSCWSIRGRRSCRITCWSNRGPRGSRETNPLVGSQPGAGTLVESLKGSPQDRWPLSHLSSDGWELRILSVSFWNSPSAAVEGHHVRTSCRLLALRVSHLTQRCRLTAALLWARFARFFLMRPQLNANVMRRCQQRPRALSSMPKYAPHYWPSLPLLLVSSVIHMIQHILASEESHKGRGQVLVHAFD
jgi:hypothetical protein